jgi:hypothetical protein
MRGLPFLSAFLVCALLTAGCSTKPPARIGAYLGAAVESAQTTQTDLRVFTDAPRQVGLLLINDTSLAESAPALSEGSRAYLTEAVWHRIEEKTPIRIAKVLSSSGLTPETAQQRVISLGREQGVPYVLVVIFSSMESEIPLMLPFTGDPEQGGGRPRTLGFEAINYALAELALLETSSGKVVARSDGRAWSRLNRLNVPIESNAYPVIHRSLRVAPIYPKEENAKDVLRSVAGDEALEQAVMRLQEAWPRAS